MPLYPRNRGLLVAMEIPTGRQQPSDGYCSSQKYPLGSTTLSAQSDSSFSSLVVDSLSTVSLLSKGGICSVIGEDWSSEFRRGLERSAFGEASSAEVPFSPSTSPSGSSWSSSGHSSQALASVSRALCDRSRKYPLEVSLDCAGGDQLLYV